MKRHRRGQRHRWSLEERLKRMERGWKSINPKETTTAGETAEEKFLQAWDVSADNPPWFCGVERATLEEDYLEGKDAYIFITGGLKIPVQVKSSLRGMESHREKYPNFSGIIILIVGKDTPLLIRLHTERLLREKGLLDLPSKT